MRAKSTFSKLLDCPNYQLRYRKRRGKLAMARLNTFQINRERRRRPNQRVRVLTSAIGSSAINLCPTSVFAFGPTPAPFNIQLFLP
jgi:hypothetical protein